MTRLKVLRERRGYSQASFCKEAKVNFRMYQNYEQGSRSLLKAKLETVLAIANTLGCEVEDLLGDA